MHLFIFPTRISRSVCLKYFKGEVVLSIIVVQQRSNILLSVSIFYHYAVGVDGFLFSYQKCAFFFYNVQGKCNTI